MYFPTFPVGTYLWCFERWKYFHPWTYPGTFSVVSWYICLTKIIDQIDVGFLLPLTYTNIDTNWIGVSDIPQPSATWE
jgi:hypothetical protein